MAKRGAQEGSGARTRSRRAPNQTLVLSPLLEKPLGPLSCQAALPAPSNPSYSVKFIIKVLLYKTYH